MTVYVLGSAGVGHAGTRQVSQGGIWGPDDAAESEERLVDVLALALLGKIYLLALRSFCTLTTGQVDEMQLPGALHHRAIGCYHLG